MQLALVCGAGGFIGSHLVNRLKREGLWVRGVDLKHPEFSETAVDDFVIGDLRDPKVCKGVTDRPFHEVYQLAADMGGAGYIFSGEHDSEVMHNSAMINLNMVDTCWKAGVRKIFYSSSACIYPEYNQRDPNNPRCSEESAYPAAPDSEYGWEKLFSERMYLAYHRNHGLAVRIARFHNIFGPEGQGPLGVRGRNSDNRLIHEKLNWKPCRPLREGMAKTYLWIQAQVKKSAPASVFASSGQ
jgi:GDP-D-mannose 3', 5'-epimerase